MKAIHIKAFDIWYGMEKGAGGGIHAEEKASFTTTLTARRLLYLFEKEREREELFPGHTCSFLSIIGAFVG